jgi:PAS domain S-box-containing protein
MIDAIKVEPFDSERQDLSPLQRAQVALRESENRFVGVVAAMPGGVFQATGTSDGTFEFIYTSEGFRELFGLAPEEFQANPHLLLNYVHPADRDNFLQSISVVISNLDRWQWQGRVMLPTGQEEVVRCSALPVLGNKEGQVIWSGLLMDVTDCVRAEHKAAQLEAIVEGSADAIKGKTLDGIITSWNPAAERMFGYTAEEMVGQPMSRLLPPDRPNEIKDLMKRIARGESVRRYETERRAKDGTMLDISLTISPVRDSEGRVIGASTIAQDVTEQHRIEARLRSSESVMADAQALAHVGSWELDVATQIVRSSDEMLRLLGLAPAEWSRGLDAYLGRIHPDERQHSEQAIFEAIRTGRSYEVDERFLLPDGSERVLHTMVKPTLGEGGEAVKVVGMSLDVTDRRRAEVERLEYLRALEEARDIAQAATRAKSEFLANMSHEIRTPMNGVIGMTGLLLDTVLTVEQREYAQTIKASGETLLTIINDILDLSKVEAGKMIIEVSDFNLQEAMADVAELMAARATLLGLPIYTEMSAGVPEQVRGDVGRIRQILTNFVSNAVKFTKRGKVTLSADVMSETPTHVNLRLNVRDTGIGIAPEHQMAIFESFIQADGSTTRRYGGTGLGLTISRQLAALMGGKIGVDSVIGLGSCFWLELTLEKHLGISTPHVPLILPPGFLPPLSGLRVLIAEDNSTNQKLALRLLQKWGCYADAVANGLEALDALAIVPYDLVLMDMQMPELDGLETIVAIRLAERTSGEHIPVIAMTASAMTADRDVCLSSGMDDYISKPFKAQELYAKIVEQSTRRQFNPDERRLA